MTPTLAIYDCDTHCVACAEARFGQALYDGPPSPCEDSLGEAPSLVYDWEFEPSPHGEHCGTCHAEICEPCCPRGYEVFHMDADDIAHYEWRYDDGEPMREGWYWWSCQPGCLPDGEPTGPFETEAEALHDLLDDYPG